MTKTTRKFLILALLTCTTSAMSFTIAEKGRVAGPAIHATYFMTPNNQSFPVHADAYAGNWVNGVCVNANQIDIGKSALQSGDFVDLDAFQLKALIGGGYTCLTITYFYKQPVIDSFQLVWDGFNYTATMPAVSEVTVL
jgi:hypothetical protein